jgi:shikimate kinase
MAERHVVLVGLMGTGKSTVGRRLAREMDRPFADLDEQIELAEGATVPRLFREQGEAAFRAIEATLLADLVAHPAPLVIAAGGGVVTGVANRRLLAATFVVWLQASPRFLAGRTDPTHRPLLAGGDAQRRLARLLEQRRALYEEVADVTVDVEPFHAVDDKPKRALARHISELVAQHTAAHTGVRS